MRLSRIEMVMLSALAAGLTGCIPLHRHPATQPATEPMATTQPVATEDVGTATKIPGLAPKPKPFIALPGKIQAAMARPSTLLLEHASPDSPVPLSEYAKQPTHRLSAFHLHKGLTEVEVQQLMGLPAQLADTEDPWFVYRLNGDQELWLHFSGATEPVLDAADVVRGAEDGYIRDRVFSAD